MAGKRIEPRLRAEFRKAAREIIGRDRFARKHGLSQNTIGEIERALVGAFELGRTLGDMPFAPPRAADHPLDWEELAPRGREVLDSLTYRNEAYPTSPPLGLRRLEIAGRNRWALIWPDGRVSERHVATGSVDPLVRLGLLEPGEAEDVLILSPRGFATCEAYWRRVAAEDPTLPRMSIRA